MKFFKNHGANRSFCQLQDRSERGSALLIVLAFIVILAVVLLAFLSNSQRSLQQSQSSTAIVKTQMLGEVATAAIIDDLVDEMKAGSDEDPAEGTAMKVSQPWAMVPKRVLKVPAMSNDANFNNLVKQSVSGQPFFPNLPPYRHEGRSRASNANTFDPSRNQRIISTQRWDKPKLLGTAGSLGNFASTQLPDWILITRAGAVPSNGALDKAKVADKTPTSTSYVLGRFAYNIYQVDGLLDINVAGFAPTNASSAASKGSLAWADLRAIPGFSSDSNVADFIAWRNKLSDVDYPAMVAGRPAASPNATPGPWGEPGGFLKPYTNGTQSDNRFFSRQDLLKFLSTQFPAGSNVINAAPFLTTFSADLDQPSFRPDPNRPAIKANETTGGNDGYGNEGQAVDKQINPSLLAVRNGDQPVVKRRFPLERLKYVTPNPDSTAAGKIEDYFGLRWTGDKWEYIAKDGDGSIRRLHEVGDNPPNMIELLKAAIAAGSLGSQLNVGELHAQIMEPRDSSIDYQIMKIAASIIDQYDEDSYPTRILFNGSTISGVEDLPYLYGLRTAPYRINQLNPATALTTTGLAKLKAKFDAVGRPIPDDLYRNVVMIQPILWNPHALGTGTYPTSFRVTASTIRSPDGLPISDIEVTAKTKWWVNTGIYDNDWNTVSKLNDPRDLPGPGGVGPRSFSPDDDYIRFTPTSATAFREPYVLKSPNYPAGTLVEAFDSADGATGSSVDHIDPAIGPEEQNDGSASELSLDVIGFRAGYAWGGPWLADDTYLQIGKVEGGTIDFALQYLGPGGQWITYDTYEKFSMGKESFDFGRSNHGASSINPRFMRYYLRADPRTDRFGMRLFYAPPRYVSDTAGIPPGKSIRPDEKPGIAPVAGAWPADAKSKFRFNVPSGAALGQLSENKSTDSGLLYYEDADGIARLAMGGRSLAGNTPGLPMAKVVNGNFNSRPVILNRPFRSVAELGYAMRDQPWKQLDFFSPQSGDAALLDMFCLYEPEDPEADPIVAGRVNLNTRRAEVIEALLRGVKTTDSASLPDADANALAQALVNWTANTTDPGKGPLRNRAEVIGKFVTGATYSGFSSQMFDLLTGEDKMIPVRHQNVLRGLVDPGTTRAWTFLIDLIVQDGQFTKPGAAASDFVVRGEKRYWVHVSMDRFTGEVISQRMEEVHE